MPTFPTDSAVYMKKDVLNEKLNDISSEEGLTPRQAIATKEFAILSTKIMLTELVFFYLLFVYKMSANGSQVLDNSFHYNFEPFFTLQPNLETRKQQLKAWRQLIVDYYESISGYVLDVNQSINEPLFRNNKINRQLSLDSIRVILNDLHSNGLIEWLDQKRQDKCYVYWKRPEEWAQLIHKWVEEKSLNNTVCTLYEITSGEQTVDYAFHGLNEDILVKALKCLEINGKAVLINFDNNSGITSGEQTVDYAFHGLNEDILIKALKCLEIDGKAVLINFDNNSGPFGQTFIADDFFLSIVGASAAVCNTLCRILVGHLKDMTTYKICCLPLSCLATILVVALPLTPYTHRMVYAVCVVCAVGIVGSQYALMPSAITEAFGERFASINIGLVYMSTVIADIAGAFASQHLTDTLGWSGMIALVGVCALIDFLITFLLPNNQHLRLKKRLVNRDMKSLKAKCCDDKPFAIGVYNCNTIANTMTTRRTKATRL
ncbi:unnamed protein product [Medioppia subpectinata]|uniref:Vacuolar protein-sorting-associated protein 25 n=1 Tax=Medioppia subpectinata TaxID=1979941 RepID=A0A7R9L1Z3_9ACAR|nr:unnamed protein product [Medioppia subpectinata]CAG2112820.1 unnamed protein product [Medioppia subpectinata]